MNLGPEGWLLVTQNDACFPRKIHGTKHVLELYCVLLTVTLHHWI